MGLAATIARRSLAGRPGRTFFSVLGVAMGIAIVVAIFTVDHVTVLSRTLGYARESKIGADLEVRPAAGVDDPRSELLRLEGVAGVAAYFQNDVLVRPVPRVGDPPGDDVHEAVRLVALEAQYAPDLGVYHVDRGSGLDPARGTRDVLVGAGLAQAQGLEPGDQVYLAPPRRAARQACVEGRLQRVGDDLEETWRETVFRVAGILAREGVGRAAQGKVVVVDYQAGRRLFDGMLIEPRFWVKRDASVDLEALESGLTPEFSFEHNRSATIGQAADERAFRNGVRLAGLFALLLGLFVIFHTLSMSLIERVNEVGALHTLGTSRGQIARVFLTEALVVSGLAGVLGFGGGLLLAKLMLRAGITTLGMLGRSVRLFEVPWRITLSLTLIGIGIALVGSVFPILAARSTDVVGLLRGQDLGRRRSVTHGFHLFVVVALIAVLPAFFFAVVPVIGSVDAALVRTVALGLIVLAGLLGWSLFSPTLLGRVAAACTRPAARVSRLAAHLAGQSLAQSSSRVGSSVAALALVTSAFVGLKGMTNSLRAEIDVWADVAVQDKVFFDGLKAMPLAELSRIARELPEVVAVEPGSTRAFVGFRLHGLRISQLEAYGPCAREPGLAAALEDDQGILLSGRLAAQLGLGVGDAVPIRTSGHGVQVFHVAAVSDEYGYFMNPDERAYGVVSDRWMKRYFCLDVDTVDSAALRLAPGADHDAVVAALWGELRPRRPNLRALAGPQIRALHLEDITRDFVVFDIILALTACLAGLGVLNGQLLAALERQKELGVLRALGMTQRQLAGTVLLETGILGLFGGLLGALLGAALTPILVSSLRALSGLDMPLAWAGGWLPVFVLGAVVLSLLAGLIPLWRMTRMDPVRAVRTG